MKRVVVIGGGFAGLNAARELAGQGVEVLLLDRNNYHLFQPLLYQVATAGLELESIAYPIRAITRNWPNVRYKRADVISIDPHERGVITSSGERIGYDFLIIALGSTTNFFGNDRVAAASFDLKRLSDAEAVRNRILSSFEEAVTESDPTRRRSLTTFVVVGGGPTGVEFAGALAELVRYVIAKDYPELRTDSVSIHLVESAERLLLPFSERLSRYAEKTLRKMGVTCHFGLRVVDADGAEVRFHDGSSIKTNLLFWSAGVCAPPVAGLEGIARKPGGRIPVLPDLSVPGHPEIFVAGDMAWLEQKGTPLPMVAPVAMQMGRYAARRILATLWERPLSPFVYRDKGSMATIGRSAAVAMTHGLSLTGYPAWLAWLLLHLYYLIGFRNRVVVMLNWMWYYWFHERQVRLITEPLHQAPTHPSQEVQ
ncbi:MAG: NAD(P)/FAD-dependent oxidoreductase [Desulfuromonadia bacterium]